MSLWLAARRERGGVCGYVGLSITERDIIEKEGGELVRRKGVSS
jgi:hypothetical protein